MLPPGGFVVKYSVFRRYVVAKASSYLFLSVIACASCGTHSWSCSTTDGSGPIAPMSSRRTAPKIVSKSETKMTRHGRLPTTARGCPAGELRVRARWASRQRTAAPIVKGLVEALLNGLRDLVGDGPHGRV